MLRPEEVELLVCGTETLDLHELRKATEYDGYRPDDSIIWYDNLNLNYIIHICNILHLQHSQCCATAKYIYLDT